MFAVRPICVQDSIFKMSSESSDDACHLVCFKIRWNVSSKYLLKCSKSSKLQSLIGGSATLLSSFRWCFIVLEASLCVCRKCNSKWKLFRLILWRISSFLVSHLLFCHAGAQDDLRKVTDMAYLVVRELGMSPHVGHVSFPSRSGAGDEAGKKPYSKQLAALIDTVRYSIDWYRKIWGHWRQKLVSRAWIKWLHNPQNIVGCNHLSMP